MAYKRKVEIFEEAYTKKGEKSILSYDGRDGKKRYIAGSSDPDVEPGGGGGTGIESIEQTVTSEESGGVNVITVTTSDGATTDFQVRNGMQGATGPKGDQGNSGYSGAAGELEVVNNLTDGGEESALSAEMGKTLKGMIDSKTIPVVDDLTTGGRESALSAEMGKYLNEGSSQNYIKNFCISANGQLFFVNKWNHFPDYFPCTQGDRLVWTPGVAYTSARLVFYDSSKEVISSYSANAVQRTVTAPAGAAYVRVPFNDMYGDVQNTIPLKIGDVEYPRTEDKVGVKDIPITHIPNAIANNLYGYLYNHFGITDVPTDAMLYENKTIQGTTVSVSDTKCIAQLPVNFGYGIRIIPADGYKIDLRFFTYEQVGSEQISATTIISTNGIATNPITALIPHGAHMAVIWVAKTSNATITPDDAKLGFSVQLVKIPDVPRAIKSVNHRGYNSTHPENTLVAFQESRRQGFFCVETDVRTTSDGVLVLLHDPSINRTARNADGTAISGTVNIADITYQQALEYDFGIARGSRFAGTKIPTLAQFLSLCKRLGLHAYLETKDVAFSALVQAVNDVGMRGHVTYLGGDGLATIKELDPNARLAMLGSNASVNLYNTLKTETNEVVADLGNVSNLETFRAAGIPVEVYVIDTTSYLDNMDSYISGVTSNTLVADRYLYLTEIL